MGRKGDNDREPGDLPLSLNETVGVCRGVCGFAARFITSAI